MLIVVSYYILLNIPTHKHVNLRLTKTQLLLQSVHRCALSHTSFLSEVLNLKVYLFWLFLPFRKTTGIMQASPSKNIVFDKEHLYSAIQEREFKPFMEVKCVRSLPIVEPARLKCGEQLEF